jgi:hypothetical protein
MAGRNPAIHFLREVKVDVGIDAGHVGEARSGNPPPIHP